MFSLKLIYNIFVFIDQWDIICTSFRGLCFKVIFGSLLLFPRPKGKKVKREKSRSLALRIKPKKQKKEKESKEKDKKKKKKSETLSPPQAPSKGVTLQDLSSKYKFSSLTAQQFSQYQFWEFNIFCTHCISRKFPSIEDFLNIFLSTFCLIT